MILVERDKNNLRVFSDIDLKGLEVLTLKKMNNGYFLDVRDFLNFKEKLDEMNISEREMTKEAMDLLHDYFNKIERYEEIKTSKILKYSNFADKISLHIKTQPFIDQIAGINFLLSRQFVGNWDTMGSGKTFMALSAFSILMDKGLVKKGLVVCPNMVKLSWQSEIEKHTDLSYKIVGNGTVVVLSDLEEYEKNPKNLLIIHYDCFIKENIKEALKKMNFDVIIFDEVHLIKNLKTQRTKAVLDFIDYVKRAEPLNGIDFCEIVKPDKPFIWCFSGTPVSEHPNNAFVLLKILDPNFKINFFQFDRFFNRYITINVKKRLIKKLIGFKNISHLKRYFVPLSIRRTREELVGMPEKIFMDRILEFSEKQQKIYNTVREGVLNELRKLDKRVNLLRLENVLVRLHQVLNHPQILDMTSESIKHDAILFLLEELLQNNQKVIIWFIYRKGGELLYEKLKSLKIPAALIYGGVELEELEKIKDLFEKDKISVILASIKKMGTGIDFLKQARTAIYLDLPFSLVEYMQSQDRIVRRGIFTPAVFIHLIVKNTLDELILSLLRRKTSFLESIVDDKDIEVDINEILQQI